jgi:peptide/nickel transport system permease protein
VSAVNAGPVDGPAPVVKHPAWLSLRRQLGPFGLAALMVIAGLGLMALFAPVLPVVDPTDVDLTNTFAPPSVGHPFGTDSNGRDILARLVWGSRTALLGPLIVTVVATAVGVLLAVVASWRGGWFDGVVSRLFDLLFAFPGILLALVVAAVIGAGFGAGVAALSAAYIPYIGRVTRGAALQQLRQPYVASLRVLGQSPAAICARHLVPNLGTIIVAQATVTFGYALVDLAALSYLGLGVDQATPDWGVIVAAGQSEILSGYPQQSMYAGVLIVIAVVAFCTVAERIAGREHYWRRLR